jgi:hypothetical protein
MSVLDNFTMGHKSNIEDIFNYPKFESVDGDVSVFEY